MGDLMTATYAQARLLPALQSGVINAGILKSLTETRHRSVTPRRSQFAAQIVFYVGLGISSEALQYRHINQEPAGYHESD